MDESAPTGIEKRIKWAGLLIALGIIVQIVSLSRIHPLAFVAFSVIGCPLVAAGIVIYLVGLVQAQK